MAGEQFEHVGKSTGDDEAGKPNSKMHNEVLAQQMASAGTKAAQGESSQPLKFKSLDELAGNSRKIAQSDQVKTTHPVEQGRVVEQAPARHEFKLFDENHPFTQTPRMERLPEPTERPSQESNRPAVEARPPAVAPDSRPLPREPLQAPRSNPAEVAGADPRLERSKPVEKAKAHLQPSEKPSTTMIPADRTSDHWLDMFAQHQARAKKGDIDTIFYGDSITEGMGDSKDFKATFGKGAEAFGNIGDSTQHLLYRLQNGEGQIAGRQPEKGVILVGTNNLSSSNASNHDIARGVLAVVHEATKDLPNTKFLVLGILPHGALPSDPRRIRIDAVNREVQGMLAAEHNPNVHYADIGKELLQPNGSMGNKIWEPDHWHPTQKVGNQALFGAIKPILDGI